MKHSNISVFIPHAGCPHTCSFCNQKTISGASHAPSGDEVREICKKALSETKSPENTEIAFFGGSFTAIPRDYMTELLSAAKEFTGEGKFSGIRISTRPDYIDPEILVLLKSYGVTAIELGAQSMSEKVLELNERGHTAQDVENASVLIRTFGFELGLQMMVGLYGSTEDDEKLTMERIERIHPDTVRIYPVVILKGTRLDMLRESGEYVPFSFEKAVEISAAAMILFETGGIKVIKCGLHASEFVEKDMTGGFYHPAFRELCDGMIYRYNLKKCIGDMEHGNCTVAVSPTCISRALGHKKTNYSYFLERGIKIRVIGDERIPKYQCELRGE